MSEENEQKLKEYGNSSGNARKMRLIFAVVYSIKKIKEVLTFDNTEIKKYPIST